MARFSFLFFLNFIFFFSVGKLNASVNPASKIQLKWDEPRDIAPEASNPILSLYFDGATMDNNNGYFLPIYSNFIQGQINFDSEIKISKIIVAPLTVQETKILDRTQIKSNDFIVESKILTEKKNKKLWFKIIPFRLNSSGQIEKLVSFETEVISKPKSVAKKVNSGFSFAANSVLSTGTWYRIGVSEDGMYKLDIKFLRSLGIETNTINPQFIRIFGNGGKQLPFDNSVSRPDDLIENAIFVEGEADGKFDSLDYVWFYGQSPHLWKGTNNCSGYTHRRHMYSDTTYYFINVDLAPGLRINSENQSVENSSIVVNSFDEMQFYENEAVNVISSGREWLGEKFDGQLTYNFDFNFPNLSFSDSLFVLSKVLSKSYPPSTFNFECQGATASVSPVSINPNNFTSDYGKFDSVCFKFLPNSQNPSLKISFVKNPSYSSAVGFLDYIEIVGRRQLKLFGNFMRFRDKRSVSPGNIALFSIGEVNSNTIILDVSNPTLPKIQLGEFSGNTFTFKKEVSILREFVAFNKSSSAFKIPTVFGRVNNQNLHASLPVDLIIVSHPSLYSEAIRLKNLHANTDGLRTILVTPQEIYNEFSSGSQDITAIKTFCKMFYDRANSPEDMPKYLMLFGDASYNNRDRTKNGNTNFIPSYQSLNSMDLTLSYISDDYFGLLDDAESEGLLDLMDIGIGRLPAKSLEEAKNIVDKIIEYETKTPLELISNTNICSDASSNITGDWKNVICFLADDQDRNVHIRDADKIATFVDTTYNDINLEKIYFDSYKQTVNAGGQRYPDVKDALNKRMDRGALIVNYTGHGGETGWAQERVLEVSDIKAWKNKGRYPFFVTATCEFSRFDDPLRTSAGEDVLLQPGGGGIGLLTTTRLVYSAPNFTLNLEFFKEVFNTDNNGYNIRLGEVSRLTKNQSVTQFTNNHRNFSLLGDPALRLNFPKENVVTTSVEVIPSVNTNDTVKALSKVKITGYVSDLNNQKITSYNGLIYPTVYDKAAKIKTLANDSTGADISLPFDVLIQKNIVYKGKVSVVNGDFNFTFVVPKDIAFNYGKGRVSYYSLNNSTDANGFYENFVIGGANANAPSDLVGPDLTLFLNDEKFIAGSITDENPKLFSKVFDENGINTVGSGIGHDLVAILDGNTEKQFVLNDYYQSDLNSYKSGIIRYPFSDLSEGSHTLSLKVWDVYNNSSTANTEFIVSKSSVLALKNVMNYPNPFTTRTKFMFEHNRPCEGLDVQVQIFSVSGKLVKTLETILQCEGYRSDKLEWDGLDDYGDKIGKGVYVYKLKISSKDGSFAEKIEKLVLLN